MNHALARRPYAGFGCRRDCSLDALYSLLQDALAQSGITRGELAGLATIEAKRGEPGLQRLADELGVELHAWSAAALRRFEDRLTVRSERTYALLGCYGVAESAALASAAAGDPDSDVQLLAARRGNREATIALACRASASLD